MSKIKTMTVSNLKAVSEMTVDFNGCTAIITGGNNKGKTSFLRGLFDRIRGIKPEQVLKSGTEQGFAECELDTGEKLKWEFNDKGKEKLTYITEKNIKHNLTVELRNRFLPETFDVDKFLTDQPKKQKETLQKLVGLDFTKVDADYDKAFKDRTGINNNYNDQKTILENMGVPKKVEFVDTAELTVAKEKERDRLNKLYLENKKHNDGLRTEWNNACDKLRQEIQEWNAEQDRKKKRYDGCLLAAAELRAAGFENESLTEFLAAMSDDIKDPKVFEPLPEPAYIPEMPDNAALKAIDDKILSAVETNQQAQLYKDYETQKAKTEQSRKDAEAANEAVKTAENARMDLIKSAKMPEGFAFDTDGITYNGLAFTREQLSSSGIYIAALKLAAMNLGEVKSLHFDASFLDKISLSEIEAWAQAEGLQLLIERPDFEGGEIEYQLICES